MVTPLEILAVIVVLVLGFFIRWYGFEFIRKHKPLAVAAAIICGIGAIMCFGIILRGVFF